MLINRQTLIVYNNYNSIISIQDSTERTTMYKKNTDRDRHLSSSYQTDSIFPRCSSDHTALGPTPHSASLIIRPGSYTQVRYTTLFTLLYWIPCIPLITGLVRGIRPISRSIILRVPRWGTMDDIWVSQSVYPVCRLDSASIPEIM